MTKQSPFSRSSFLKLLLASGFGALFARKLAAGPSAIGTTPWCVTTADVDNATATLATITGLTYPLKAGRTYHIQCWIPFAQIATNDGFNFGWDLPSTTVTDARISAQVFKASAGTLQTAAIGNAEGSIVSGDVASTAAQFALLDGTITPVGDSDLNIQQARVGAGTLRTLRGASLCIIPIL